MGSGFQNPITIKEAIDKIHSRQYLLPAIQRKFTWSSNQIEMLFDSILRGYPINSFMLWKITDSDIKRDYKFYEFLTAYREFFAENNNDTLHAHCIKITEMSFGVSTVLFCGTPPLFCISTNH